MKHSGVQDQMSNFQKAGLCPGGWLNDFHPSYRPENSSVPLRTWQQSPLASSWHQYHTPNNLGRVKLTHASGNRPRDLSPRSGPWCACDSEPAPTRHSKAGVLPAKDLQGNKPLLVLTEAGHITLIWQQIPKQTCDLVAAAAKSLQLRPGSPIPGILQARTLEWVAISVSSAWKEKWKWSRSVMSDS